MRARAEHDRCSVCGRALTPHERLTSGVCHAYPCRRTQLLRALAARRSEAARALHVEDPESWTLALLPANERPLGNLPARRRRRFRDRLNAWISSAAARRAACGHSRTAAAPRPLAVHGESSEDLAILGQGCATCRGHCCSQGADHAFLSSEAMERYMAEHSHLRPRDALAAYLSHIPNRTYAGSCVYHGERGCTLPREMRADLCNEYYCPGLESFRQELARTGVKRGFAVAEEDRFHLPVRSAFIDAREARFSDPQR